MAKRKSRAAAQPRRSRAPRRDAQERRSRLITAAAELFERHGYNVPFEQIAAHAGVGRGTLYRNFDSRAALELAVLEYRAHQLLDELSERQSRPDAFFWALQRGSMFGALHAPAIEGAESHPILRKRISSLRAKGGRVITGAMRSARAAGLLRKDFSLRDFWILERMLRAYALAVPVGKRAKAINQALALVRKGIAPPE